MSLNNKLIGALLLFVTIGCSDKDDICPNSLQSEANSVKKTALHLNQAQAYAKLFSGKFEQKAFEDNDAYNSHNKSGKIDLSVSSIDFLIEEEDTLMYAINYGDNEGFILIAGDNSSFPILAHNNEGAIKFNEINDSHPMSVFIEVNKERIKNCLEQTDSTDSDYYEKWKDIGNEEYEYMIEFGNDEPLPEVGNKSRQQPTNRKAIYPYTGKELDSWCQKEGYNKSAPNQACIGCPALSISMLLYDVSQRTLGINTMTSPSFDYIDRYDIYNKTTETSLSKKLRQVADAIPNYNWGKSKDAESGASADDIKAGLRKLGFTQADYVNYNFENLYKNMCSEGVDYFGNKTTFSRGVLIAATYKRNGHIWFCDGYYEQSYTITKKSRKKTTTWTEYDDCLYMNWGWGNADNTKENVNGWYVANDQYWTIVDNNRSTTNYFKQNPIMFINLFTYKKP